MMRHLQSVVTAARLPLALFAGALSVLVLVASGGCARRVSVGELEDSGTAVWTRAVTVQGEVLTGRLLSLSASAMDIELRYPIEGDVRVRTRVGTTELLSGAEVVQGELTDVIREDNGRVALVRRSLGVAEVESATFHESRGEQSLRSIISTLLGPTTGALAGLFF
jgi:hypothetical protein